jgi:hypothetical protein
MAGEPMLEVAEKDGGLLVSAKVFDRDGKIIAKIIDNEFFLNRNNMFRADRPDKSTLEVFDQYDKRVLFVRYLNKRAIAIFGEFYHPDAGRISINEKAVVRNGMAVSNSCLGNFDVLFDMPDKKGFGVVNGDSSVRK